MPIVFQAKGKEHCKNIKRDAWYLWQLDSHRDPNNWLLYIKMALDDHRKMIEEEMKVKMVKK